MNTRAGIVHSAPEHVDKQHDRQFRIPALCRKPETGRRIRLDQERLRC
jgi:hypothetical protein